ncbi:MAG TPA: hypothetical protein VJ044_15775 [Candidatus Hodarchaeales archaeon]|nr:hypothetical protein [Candidatus Hodarchaeales archaeon]
MKVSISGLLVILTSAAVIGVFSLSKAAFSDTTEQAPPVNWSLSVNSSVSQLTSNISKLEIDYNSTYFEDIFFASRVRGGKLFSIMSNESELYSLISSSVSEINVTQKKASYQVRYSFLFAKPETNMSGYEDVNVFVVRVNTDGNYTFQICINQELAPFIGSLVVRLTPIVSVSLEPTSWLVSGLIRGPSSTTASVPFEVSSFLFVLILHLFFFKKKWKR